MPLRSGGALPTPMSPLLRGLLVLLSLDLLLPIPRSSGGGLLLIFSLRGLENEESLDVARPREVGGATTLVPSDVEWLDLELNDDGGTFGF